MSKVKTAKDIATDLAQASARHDELQQQLSALAASEADELRRGVDAARAHRAKRKDVQLQADVAAAARDDLQAQLEAATAREALADKRGRYQAVLKQAEAARATMEADYCVWFAAGVAMFDKWRAIDDAIREVNADLPADVTPIVALEVPARHEEGAEEISEERSVPAGVRVSGDITHRYVGQGETRIEQVVTQARRLPWRPKPLYEEVRLPGFRRGDAGYNGARRSAQ